LRARTLLELVDPFLEVIGDLMQQQTKMPPAILSWQELSDLGATLKNALCCLESLGIPDTLGHSDFNPGNILVGSQRCVFIDWAEAHVSHPFLTFEYLISHLRKGYSALTRFDDAIRSSYAQPWQSVSLPEHVSEAFLFSPLVAVFAYAVAGKQLARPGTPEDSSSARLFAESHPSNEPRSGLRPAKEGRMHQLMMTPPHSTLEPVTDVFHGVPVTDPYRWLEDQDSPRTRAWIAEQTRYARAYLDSIPGREHIRERIREFLAVETYDSLQKAGNRYFFRKRLPDQEQPCIYMREGADGEDHL